MKKLICKVSWLLVIVMMFYITSCSSHVLVVKENPKKVPPGQMKKATGSQSAKPYAPGQQKKN
jgi:hypothetical protein